MISGGPRGGVKTVELARNCGFRFLFPPQRTEPSSNWETMTLEQVQQNKAFEGTLTKYKTASKSLGGLETQFNVFLPREAKRGNDVP